MKKLVVAVVGICTVLLLATGALTAYVGWKASSAKQMALAQLKKDVARDLYDPESVRFRDLKLLSYSDHLESFDRFLALLRSESDWALKTLGENPAGLVSYDQSIFSLCGELNAKNRMGAYVGYTHFYVTRTDPAKPFVVIEGLGWDRAFVDKMCGIGSVVSQPHDDLQL